MDAGKEKINLNMLLLGCLLLCIFLAATSICLADDHKKDQKHSREYQHRKDLNGFRKADGAARDHGNETTGQIAAWSLGAINLTVAFSLLMKGIKRFVSVTPELSNSITRFNHVQKKYLMPFHYYLNPVFVGVAVLHWILSRCQSTALAEWGLLGICFIASLGIILKFKLVSKTSLRNVYKLHTHPLIFISLIGLLVAGHLIMD